MATILFWIGAFLLLLVLLSFIPGLNNLVKPIIDVVFSLLKATFVESYAFFIWGIKAIIDAHQEVLRHFVLPPEKIDPSHKVKAQ